MISTLKGILLIAAILLHVSGILSFSTAPAWSHSRRRHLLPGNILFAVPTHRITIQHNGKDHILNVAEDMSILDAALEADIDVPHDCKLGVCLTCPSRIVSGTLDQAGTTLDDSVVEQGFALMCMSFPRSDAVIKSIDEDELVSAQFSR